MKNQKNPTSSKSHQQKKETRGHMALRHNIYDLKLELWHVLKPLEMQLVDIVIHKTIKWNTKEATITIQELKERTQQADTHIYAALRSLRKKNVIVWIKDKHHSIYGLNEKFFGSLLIEKHEKAYQARKKKIFLAVDNSKTTDELGQYDRRNSSVSLTKSVSACDESRQSKQSEDSETIKESTVLKKLLKETLINKSLKESPSGTEKAEESFTLSGGSKAEKQAKKEHRRKIMRQLDLLKAGVSL